MDREEPGGLYIPWGYKESGMTEQLHFHLLLHRHNTLTSSHVEFSPLITLCKNRDSVEQRSGCSLACGGW